MARGYRGVKETSMSYEVHPAVVVVLHQAVCDECGGVLLLIML